MGMVVAITRDELDAAGLRRAAARSRDARAARRMLALAMVLEGADRRTAAEACGMDRQTLRDWVHRYDDEGLGGLSDRRRLCGPSPLLSAEQKAELAAIVEAGPNLATDLATDGVVRWRRVDLQRVIRERFGVAMHERTVGKQLAALGFRRLSVRPHPPRRDPEAQETFRKTSPTS